jgi:hypothetical protein
MVYLLRYLYYFALSLGVVSCVQPYAPEVIAQPQNYLVVDGSINTGGVTTIRLARSRNLQDSGKIPVESKATVFIELEGGGRYAVGESAVAGTYSSARLQFAPGQRVRLSIRTAAQREYLSEYIQVKNTPELDAVNWRIEPGGVQLYVSTHDAGAQARYYRWEFEETWKFTSAFHSHYQWTPKAIVFRTENIFNCWRTENSTAIKIGNTLKLSQDVVADYPLQLLDVRSEKLRYRYSILVRQYALTPEEHAYWEALSKTTESIGSIYDAVPTQLTGNVHATADAAEVVLGFVGAQTVTQKRIYIDRAELPADWRFDTPYDKCELATYPPPLAIRPDVLVYFRDGMFVPVDEVTPGFSYKFSTASCVDCRLRGTNVKPGFWQD